MKVSKPVWTFNTRINRAVLSLIMALPALPLFYLLRNYPLSIITAYSYLEYTLIAFLAFFSMYELHDWKSQKLQNHFTWNSNPLSRLLLEVLISFVIPLLVVPPACYILYVFFWDMPLLMISLVTYYVLGCILSLMMMLIINLDLFYSGWQKSLIKEERIERLNIKTKMEVLRQQLSPHFLFNNFNILHHLISEEPKKALAYLKKLSDVYRYILQHQTDDMVQLSEEMKFVDDYLFLLKMRFQEAIHIEINAAENGASHHYVPPVTVQMLVENAIKHNRFNTSEPLKLTIQIRPADLILANTYRPKNIQNGAGIGLSNIRERYECLTEEKVEQYIEGDLFHVKVPLLYLA